MFKHNQLLSEPRRLLGRDFFDETNWNMRSNKWFETDHFPETNVKTEWTEKMTLTVPSTAPEDLKVSVKNGTMTLNGHNETESMQNGAKVKSLNQWSRQLSIPDNIDIKSIEVELNDTKLVIKSKKKEACTTIPVIFE